MKEHILQFAISIDEDAIVKRIEQRATEETIKEVKNKAVKTVIDTSGWSSSTLTDEGRAIVKEVFESYSDKIIAGAIESVAQSITRSKKYREVLSRIAEDMLAEEAHNE